MEVKKKGKGRIYIYKSVQITKFSTQIILYAHTLMGYPVLNSYCKVHIECAEETTDLRYIHRLVDTCP